MRRSEHERIVAVLKEELERQRAINEDLLNRCMSKDWTQYVALSNEPQPLPDVPELLYDPTGLVWVEKDAQ